MPVTGANSFMPVFEQIYKHWISMNATLPAHKPLVLSGNYELADFETDRKNFLKLVDDVSRYRARHTMSRGRLAMTKMGLIETMRDFNKMVARKLPGTVWLKTLAVVPRPTADEEKATRAFEETLRIWQEIDAAEPSVSGIKPPFMTHNADCEFFAGLLNNLPIFYRELDHITVEDMYALTERDELIPLLRRRMKEYAQMVALRAGVNSPLAKSLPSFAGLPGSLPESPFLQTRWESRLGAAVLFWEQDAGDVRQYSVRTCAGRAWDERRMHELELVNADVREYTTGAGFEKRGDVNVYKVFALLESGEADSDAVSATYL